MSVPKPSWPYPPPGAVGPVWSFPSAGRRLARHLAARPNHPSTSSTREIRPHTDAPHQTPPGRPTGDDAKLQTGPSRPRRPRGVLGDVRPLKRPFSR
ncbi:hypothetical protein CP966_28670 [Streptomyces galilaeus]|nr:hypothetical protein CP966_28670 [Streptomyces galilaeus]